MPVVLQTHPNHSSASTKRQLKRCRERRKVELLCLFWEWVFWAVCWRWVSISWNEFDGTQLSLCRTNTHTSKDPSNAAQQLAASGQPPQLTQAEGATAAPRVASPRWCWWGQHREASAAAAFSEPTSPFQFVMDFDSSVCQAAPFL